MDATYIIPAENREAVEKKLAVIMRKARRLRLTQQLSVRFEHDHIERWTEYRYPALRPEHPDQVVIQRTREWLKCHVTGDPVKVGDFVFLATLYHTTEGTIINAVPGSEDLPERFRAAGPACEHCNAARRRNDTFVVKSLVDGSVKQVGRDCLQDYMGRDPHAVAKWAEVVGAFTSWFSSSEEGPGRARGVFSWGLLDVLKLTAAAVRKDGWMSRSRAKELGFGQATADVVMNVLTADTANRHGQELVAEYRPTEADETEAQAIYDWAQEQLATEPKSDYESNLQVVTRADSVNGRTVGLAASLIVAYRKAMGLLAERKAAATNPSQWMGRVGERMRGVPVTVTNVRDFSNDFGPRTMLSFRDDTGNVFVWWTGAFRAETGEQVYLTGTVKRHGEYKGVKQTELQRCELQSATDVDADAQHWLEPVTEPNVKWEKPAKVKKARKPRASAEPEQRMAPVNEFGLPGYGRVTEVD